MLRGVLIAGSAALVGWVLFFQILIPYAFNRPMFGLFRSRDRLDLENDLAELRAEEDNYHLEEELERSARRNDDHARQINK